MEFFLDTADIRQVEPWVDWIDGITTNPTLVARMSQPYRQIIRELCELVEGPVSAEITDFSSEEAAYKQGRILADVSEHVVVKVPSTILGLKVGGRLVDDGIRINVTLCFSVAQAVMANKVGATYISPFIGRLEDNGEDGLKLIQDLSALHSTTQLDFDAYILAASIRSVHHVEMSAKLGAHAVTIPPALMPELFAHPLTDKGMKKFEDDWAPYAATAQL